MNILIVTPAAAPDGQHQHSIQHRFGRDTRHEVRHASGMLESAWLLRHFNPDVVVFPDGETLALLGRLFALQSAINPALTLLQLDAAGRPVSLALPDSPSVA